MNHIRTLQTLRHPPVRDILTDFEGLVKPGEMLRTRIKFLCDVIP
jgi:ATP-binding cassette subfamily G (WHITE) protein 2 (SNQ2)